uniref:peptidylprolyl isomerase n=1 Tax=Lotharella oceanica TaxID=641309 RepID=A0A7S2TH77_9EUKA|mmetsp:Transcript_12160/g.23394  ORF Transcript_12160/g.23394 Transcript_12160/m.23394 type:complete len:355 (+) Transcript_12160:29-1093(+)
MAAKAAARVIRVVSVIAVLASPTISFKTNDGGVSRPRIGPGALRKILARLRAGRSSGKPSNNKGSLRPMNYWRDVVNVLGPQRPRRFKSRAKRLSAIPENGRGGGISFAQLDQTIYDVQGSEEDVGSEDLDESDYYVDMPPGLATAKNFTMDMEFGEQEPRVKWRHDLHGYLAPYPYVPPPKTGFIKKTIKEGWGPIPELGMTCVCHITGFGKDGDINEKFWSSYDGGDTTKPVETEIGANVWIPALEEALLTMRVGEKACVIAAPDYAYGAKGFPDWGVQGNSPVKFEIELKEIYGGKWTVYDRRNQLRRRKKPKLWKFRGIKKLPAPDKKDKKPKYGRGGALFDLNAAPTHC